LKVGRHPKEHAKRTEKHFYDQLREIGAMFDWKRTLETYDSAYYRWTQWLFIKLLQNNLAYQAENYVNWCPSCKTVLANEQVKSGKCDRCDSDIEQKIMKEWNE
jgi:leucyl-tRNA synthetase